MTSAVELPMKTEFIFENLPIGNLRNDSRYQRDLDLDWVEEIVAKYRKELFMPIVIGMRDDGSLMVVDGQHRVLAARKMSWETVPCQIFESTGYEHESLIYELLQTQRAQLSVAQRFKARLARNEQIAVEINNIVNDMGLKLTTSGHGQTAIQCFTACEKSHQRGNLKDVLTVIIRAWNYDFVGFRSYFVDTVSVFLSTLKAEQFALDMDRVVDSLSKISPSGFLRDMALTKNPHATFMRTLLEKYNKGLRSGRIEVEDPSALIASAKNRLAMEKRDPAEVSAHMAKVAAARRR
jgi:hypothetical protein